jgi:uncharacterized membrane protein YciS (DUF1049 family)
VEVSIWQFGILLIGIGFCIGFIIVCINLGIIFKRSSEILVKINKILDDNEKKIGNIVNNVDNISSNVDKVISIGTNISNFLKGIEFISNLFIKNEKRRKVKNVTCDK